jgi:Ca2+-binding RTX toxin-like protein
MKPKTLCSLLFVVVMLAVAPLELSAKTLGMVANNDFFSPSVTVFDADTHAIFGTVPIARAIIPDPATGDVLITPDTKIGFVTNFDYKVFVIDLTTSPPSLAGGTNPITISNAGEDLSISPDGKFLVVSDGGFVEPISVIDIAARTEISTFFPGSETVSVDVCSDSSVLITSAGDGRVRRLTVNGTGTLTDTGEMLLVDSFPVNVYCAPGAKSGVAIGRTGGEIISFSIPGLSVVDTRFASGEEFDGGITGAINPSGNRVFVRGNGPGFVDIFEFDSATGTLGASPLLTIFVAEATPFLGIDQIAVHPNGDKLFVSEPNALNVYDPTTGTLLASITDPNIVSPTGVTVVTEADPCAGDPPAGAIVGTNGPNQINGTSSDDIIFGLGGSDQINGRGGNDLICGGAGSDQLNGNAGDDTIVGGPESDLINGNAGDDTLNAQDGVNGNDSVSGGSGNDTCTGDPGDALSSCNP